MGTSSALNRLCLVACLLLSVLAGTMAQSTSRSLLYLLIAQLFGCFSDPSASASVMLVMLLQCLHRERSSGRALKRASRGCWACGATAPASAV